MTEFAANNYINASTGITPFFADNGFHLCTGVESLQANQKNNKRARLLTADKIVKNQEKIASNLQDQLVWAQQEQTYWADQHHQPHPDLKVGNLMYMDVRHFTTGWESKSLSSKNAGPWKIIRNIANKAYKLNLPQKIKDAGITPVFHS